MFGKKQFCKKFSGMRRSLFENAAIFIPNGLSGFPAQKSKYFASRQSHPRPHSGYNGFQPMEILNLEVLVPQRLSS
jgi:hypothetical protein